ncbi:hypothetical protein [Cohaesibacter gelatinilyticus]|uniref:hypothetical protein n=1 Tax=Cohaesibacter gelatinilyticus TaxID=372072 RepID=UPI000BE31B3E|nr:hypothetical protein [Cohaesibacter gelatinilyticus]
MTNDPQHQAADKPQEPDARSIIIWSSAAMAGIAIVGLTLWANTGTAVFFDRISGAIAGCF